MNHTSLDLGQCGHVLGTDGTQFHPHVEANQTLWIFDPYLGRSFKYEHVSGDSVEMHNLTALRFYASEKNWSNSTQNLCYCLEEKPELCQVDYLNLRKVGVFKNHLDVIASTPFFSLNPELLKDSGIKEHERSGKDKIGSFVDVEPVSYLLILIIGNLFL